MPRGGVLTFLPVHLRHLTAEREAQDHPQQNYDREYDNPLKIRVADRADDIRRHQELKAEHQRIFKGEPQLNPGVARQAVAGAGGEEELAPAEDSDRHAAHDNKNTDKFDDGSRYSGKIVKHAEFLPCPVLKLMTIL